MASKVADVFVSLRGDSSQLAADLAKAKAQIGSQMGQLQGAFGGLGRSVASLGGVFTALFRPSALGYASAMGDRLMGTVNAFRGAGNVIAGVFGRKVPEALKVTTQQATQAYNSATSASAGALRVAEATARARAVAQRFKAAGIDPVKADLLGMDAHRMYLAEERAKIASLKTARDAARQAEALAARSAFVRIGAGGLQLFSGLIQGASGFARSWAASIGGVVRTAAAGFGQIKALGERLGGSMLIGMAPLAAVGTVGTSIKFAADFEYEMTRVGAVTNATSQQFQGLTAHARQLGRDTVFTATQAADAMTNLATAGFNVTEIHQAMGDTMNLAAAGGLNVADAALYMARVIRSQKLPATESERVADVLTLGFHRSATDLPSLAEAFRAVGPITRQAGMEIEQTTGILMAFANAGITGSSAGNNLKRIMQRFVGEPAMVRKAFQELGIEIANERGQMKPMADIIDELSASLEGLTDVEKANRIGKISGLYAQSALQELLTIGGDAIRYNMELVSEHGAASDFAARRVNTLTGSFLIMMSSIQDVQIALGASLTPALREVFGKVVEVMNATSKWIEANRPLVLQIFQTTAAVGGLLISLPLVGAAFSALFGPIPLAVAGITALVMNFDNLGSVGSAAFQGLSTVFKSVWGFMVNAFNAMRPTLESLGAAFMTLFNNVADWFGRNQATIEHWGTLVGEIFNNVIRLGGQLLDWILQFAGASIDVDGSAASWDRLADRITTALDAISFWTTDFETSWQIMCNSLEAIFFGVLTRIEAGLDNMLEAALRAFTVQLGVLNFIPGFGGVDLPEADLGFAAMAEQAANEAAAANAINIQRVNLRRERNRLVAFARQLGVEMQVPELIGQFDTMPAAMALRRENVRLLEVERRQRLDAAMRQWEAQRPQRERAAEAAADIGGAFGLGPLGMLGADAARRLAREPLGEKFRRAMDILPQHPLQFLFDQQRQREQEERDRPKAGGVKIEEPKAWWQKIQEGIKENPRERQMQDDIAKQRQAVERILGVVQRGWDNLGFRLN